MPIGTPAGIINVLVLANTGQANAALTKTRAAFRLTGVEAQSSAAATSNAWKKAGAATALAAGVVGAASGKMAIDFDRSMRNVNSIAQLPEKQFQKTGKAVLDMAGDVAQAPVTISEGLYDLVSSGFNAAEALGIVRQSAKAATAGLTETQVSTKAVAAVLNAYRLPATAAKDVSDTLFRTVDKGVITFEDLAQNIGDTLPFAASLGVNLSQVGAATATLTKQGLSASETMTRIRNVIQTLIKPGLALKATFKDLGTTGEELVRKKGLQGALKTLVGTTDGTKEAVAALFPNIRALGGALALTGENTREADKDLRALKDHSGATAHALEEQSKSVAYQWNQVKAEVSALAIEFGGELLPIFFTAIQVFGDVGGAVFDIAGALGDLDGTAKLVVISMGAAVIATKGFMLLSGPVMALATNIQFMGSMLGTAATQGTMLATTGALLKTAFTNHPLLTVAAGAGLLVGGVAGLASAFGGLFDSEKKLPPVQQRLIETSDNLKEALKRQKEAMGAIDGSAERVRKAHRRAKGATDDVRKAEKSYQSVLEKYPKNSRQAVVALAELREAKKKERQATKAAERAEREHGAIRKATKPIIRQTLVAERERTTALKDERKQLMENLRSENKYGSDSSQTLQDLKKNRQQLTQALKAENATLKEATNKIGPAFAKKIEEMSNTQLQFGKRADKVAGILKNPYKDSILDLGQPLAQIRTATGKLGKGFESSQQAGSAAIDQLNTDTQRAASALGFNVPSFATSAGGKKGKEQKKQAGGRLVGGVGSGDKIHLVAEPGEVVWNREAVKAMGGLASANRPNFDFPRFGGGFQKGGAVDGGLAFALGPHDVPPIKYAADHREHWHISGTTPEWVVGVGKALQKMGFTVGEHPAFGGVGGGHGSYGPTDHYHGGAIDVNSDPVESLAESRRIAAFLSSGKIVGGAMGSAVENLARVLITGPDGPLKDMPQKIADKVRKGANDLIMKKSPTETGTGVGFNLGGNYKGPLDRMFPQFYGFGESAGQPQLSLGQTTGLLGKAGFGGPGTRRTPAEQGAINFRESRLFPGIISDRPDDRGYGLGQLSPISGGWGSEAISVYNALGGNKGMSNPWHNVQMQSWLDRNQVSDPWAATAQAGAVLSKMMQGGKVAGDLGLIKEWDEEHSPGSGFVKNFVSSFKALQGAGDRRKLVGDTIDAIRTRAAFGVDFLRKDGSLTGRLAELRALADKHGEFANNAFSLNEEAPWDLAKNLNEKLPYKVMDGEDIVQAFETEQEAQSLLAFLQDSVLGRFYGKTEAQWLGGVDDEPGRLQDLLKLRNRLVEATSRIKNIKAVIEDMVAQVERQVAAVREAIKDGAKLKADLEEERKDLQKKLQTATDNQEKSRQIIKDKLDRERAKPKKKRDEQLIASLQRQLTQKSTEKESIREDLARNHDRMQNLLGKQADRGALMTALRDKVKPAFKDRFATLVDGAVSVADEMFNVQGSVPQMGFIDGIPELGLLGGEVFEVQNRLKELNFKPGDFTDESDSTSGPGGMSIDDLLRFSEAVRLGAFGSASNIPVFGLGGISSGGYALVGDRGPEILNLPAGTQIQNNRQSSSMLPGDFYFTIKIGDRTVEETVDVKIADRDGKELGRWRQGRAPGA